ncbi:MULTISPECIES: P-loop NTPase [Cysteiniphilum]|uniref:P-loop NTPase n=1 Tax=Cysteiniphilum TaxID=2056696 RepID=UPI00193A7A95|nr:MULTISPECIES: P-loop NTPase [Cysteiniphilum]
MKSIVIYSAKGGVGKTTTTVNLAKKLVSERKKVFIIDADVNTPSTHVLLGDNALVNAQLMFSSIGLDQANTIFIQQSELKQFFKRTIAQVNQFKPDIVLIDTPPSISEIHNELLAQFDISGMFFVSQANALSFSDIKRAIPFFYVRNIRIAGVILNMVGLHKDEIDISDKLESFDVLSRIPFVNDLQFNLNDYDNVVNVINQLDSASYYFDEMSYLDVGDDEIIEYELDRLFARYNFYYDNFKIKSHKFLNKWALYLEKCVEEATCKNDNEKYNDMLYKFHDRESGYYDYLVTKYLDKAMRFYGIEKPNRFYNLQTWDYIKDNFLPRQMDVFFNPELIRQQNLSTQLIKRLLEAEYDEDKQGTFMVLHNHAFAKSSMNNITQKDDIAKIEKIEKVQLFAGEIVSARLVLNSKTHYAVPRVSIEIDGEEIILFANEVMPVYSKQLSKLIDSGMYIKVSETRYIPVESELAMPNKNLIAAYHEVIKNVA